MSFDLLFPMRALKELKSYLTTSRRPFGLLCFRMKLMLNGKRGKSRWYTAWITWPISWFQLERKWAEQRGEGRKVCWLSLCSHPLQHIDKAPGTSLIRLAVGLQPQWPALKRWGPVLLPVPGVAWKKRKGQLILKEQRELAVCGRRFQQHVGDHGDSVWSRVR